MMNPTTFRNYHVFDYNTLLVPCIMDNGDSAVVEFQRADSWEHNEYVVSVWEMANVPNTKAEYEANFLKPEAAYPRSQDEIEFVVINNNFDVMSYKDFMKQPIEDMIG